MAKLTTTQIEQTVASALNTYELEDRIASARFVAMVQAMPIHQYLELVGEMICSKDKSAFLWIKARHQSN